ncbi:hydrogenase nickel incorporation protein HypB [Nitrococcus mobilis]|uniref:Hydrogenase maturation factor HypB n=1 Tax=Nitrococcus mobilis Nb-231 TaxID=314278 RepID=A4BQ10_9GAMM|nr:hydrogenase nickel incorporation protein HypB [Nitrococcus mobilis]EAR22165.1 Hydrogenase accessory protein HypB [Nitrococcus mobilis Nb-231]
MCTSCGCSGDGKASLTDLDTGETRSAGFDEHLNHRGSAHHEHGHAHRHDEAHDHAREQGTTIMLEQALLAKNDHLAMHNRAWLADHNILALNLVSSPGAGKTTLLERTLCELAGAIPISVVEGDQESVFDAERIRATGCRAVQINTGTGCHLDAAMLARGLDELAPPPGSVVMIENVGNLVCPALFDLGESAKVVVLSVTEGDDKPMKYPHMFRAARLMLLNKLDLLAHVDFDLERCIGYARRVNPQIEVLALSARTGEGLDGWYQWLRASASTQRRTQ